MAPVGAGVSRAPGGWLTDPPPTPPLPSAAPVDALTAAAAPASRKVFSPLSGVVVMRVLNVVEIMEGFVRDETFPSEDNTPWMYITTEHK